MSVLVGDRRSARALDIANVIVAVVVWLLVIAGSDPTINVTDPFAGQVVTAQDARSYFGLNLADLYAGRTDWNTIGAYPYSPAFAMLVYPLNLLPWTLFVAAWTALLIGAVWVLTGRELFLFGMVVGAMEIAGGNISLLLAVAIVWGFRWPWTWAFVLLTKITPGIGLLWFVLRREWRQLAIALGATAAVLAVSFVLTPFNWFAWVDLLIANTGKGGTWASIPIPLVVRLPIGVLLHRVGRAAEPALGRAGRRACSRCRPCGTARSRCSWASSRSRRPRSAPARGPACARPSWRPSADPQARNKRGVRLRLRRTAALCAVTTRLQASADRRSAAVRHAIAEDLRRMREDAGLDACSCRPDRGRPSVGRRRIEDGSIDPTLETVMRVAAALGADLHARVYPGTGPAVRDRHQVAHGRVAARRAPSTLACDAGGRRPAPGSRVHRRGPGRHA